MNELATLQDLVRSTAKRGRKECLIQFEDEGRSRFSYAELHDAVVRLAGGLAARSIGPCKRVAVVAETNHQSVVASLAVIHCGAAVIPIDPQFDLENLGHVLKDADPALVFASESQAGRVQRLNLENQPEILFTDRDEGAERGWLLASGDAAELPTISPRDIAAIFYTSGTTGRPKGVPLSHANLVFQQNALINSSIVSENDRVLLPLPLHHAYPFVVGMLAPLALGLTLVLPRALTGSQVARAIHDGSVTLVIGVPRLYEALVAGIDRRIESAGYLGRQIGGAAIKACLFCRKTLHLSFGKLLLGRLHQRFGRQLRVLASGGAPLDPDLAWRLESLGWKVAVGYGLSETSPILTINPPGSGRTDSVGRPLEGVQIRLEQSAGAGKAAGEGEILAKGPGVFAGYRNLEEKSRESFTEDGWFKTGDLGRMENGWLQVTGRVSTMIVTRSGENVQPDQVESVLDTDPRIKEAGVLEIDGELAALAVPSRTNMRAEGAEAEKAVRRAVEEAARDLPSYMRPTEVAISSQPIERTRLGKIKRHKLQEHFKRAREGDSGEGLPPVSPDRLGSSDRMLLADPAAGEIWDLLTKRFPKHGLSPDSHLQSDLGVDSLGWLDLSMEIRSRIGVDLDEETIAATESVRDLLKNVQGRESGDKGAQEGDPVENPERYLDRESEYWLAPLSARQQWIGRLLRALVKLFCFIWFRLEAAGKGHISPREQLVFAPNHVSFLDPLVLVAVIPYSILRNTQFAGLADAAFANRFTAFFARLARAFPVDPQRRPGTGLAYGARVIQRKRNLVWFPEGARSRDGRLGVFLPGLGMILARHPCSVVPVYIKGTQNAMPPGSFLVLPTKVVVHFGERVSSEKLLEEGEGENAQERIMSGLKKRMEKLEHAL